LDGSWKMRKVVAALESIASFFIARIELGDRITTKQQSALDLWIVMLDTDSKSPGYAKVFEVQVV
jgi:hypothetical protein